MSDPTLKIVGDSDKAQASIVALEKKLDAVQHKLKQVSQQSRKSSKDSVSGFDKAALSLATYAGGFATLSAAVAAANRVMMENQRIRDEAAQRGKDAVPGLAKLTQIATSSEHQMQLIRDAEAMQSRGIGKTLNEAADFIFAMESANIRGADRETIAGLASNQVIGDAAEFTGVLKSLQTAIGKLETGSLTDIASKAFAASGHALASVEQLLQAASRGGTGAAALGMRDEEVLAATAILSNASNASEAGTQVKALLQSLQNQGGFKGRDFQGTLQSIAGQGMNDQKLNKFFGSSEATAGFRVLMGNMEDYQRALSDIDTAAARNLANVKISMPMQIPQIAAGLEANRAQAELDISRTELGTIANLADAMQSTLVRSAENGFGAGWFENAAGGANRYFLGDETYLNEPRNQRILQENNPELLSRILATLERMEKNSSEQLTETQRQRPVRQIKRGE